MPRAGRRAFTRSARRNSPVICSTPRTYAAGDQRTSRSVRVTPRPGYARTMSRLALRWGSRRRGGACRAQVVPQDELASQMRNARQTRPSRVATAATRLPRIRVEIRATRRAVERRRRPRTTASMPTPPAARQEMRRGANVALSLVKIAAIAPSGQWGNRVRADEPRPRATANQPGPGEGGAPGDASQRGSNANGVESEEIQRTLSKAPALAPVNPETRRRKRFGVGLESLDWRGRETRGFRRFDRRRRGSGSHRPRRRQP